MSAQACQSLYVVLMRHPEAIPDVHTAALRDVLRWNDANGDYDDMGRADLIAALRIQIEQEER